MIKNAAGFNLQNLAELLSFIKLEYKQIYL